MNEQKNSGFESDSKEGIRLVTGASKQGSQKQDNLTSTSPLSALIETMGNVAALYAPIGLWQSHTSPPSSRALPCLRHSSLPQLLRQTSICRATNASGGLRPRISTPTLSCVNKNHKWVCLIPQVQLDESKPEIQFSEKRGRNLKVKQAYGAGFLRASIASG